METDSPIFSVISGLMDRQKFPANLGVKIFVYHHRKTFLPKKNEETSIEFNEEQMQNKKTRKGYN